MNHKLLQKNTFSAPRGVLLSFAPCLISADKGDDFYTWPDQKHVSCALMQLRFNREGLCSSQSDAREEEGRRCSRLMITVIKINTF